MPITPEDLKAVFQAAVAAHRAGRLEEAEAGYRRAAPYYWRARDNLALLLLADGRLEEGFALYEERFTRPERRVFRPTLSFPEWDGGAVERLLVWPEQGIGDQILHARFVPRLVERGVRVSLLAPPTLARLFEGLGATVIAQQGQVRVPRMDRWATIGSLAHRLRVTAETLPREPYLAVGAAGRGGGGVGVVWKGDPRHASDHLRSLRGEDAEQLKRLGRSLAPEDTGAKDFMDTAEIIAGLDLVISVDTSVANLAGAMGKPCWVLLWAEGTDWRWMHGRESTIWYPSVRVFRQSRQGDWSTVLKAVERELERS